MEKQYIVPNWISKQFEDQIESEPDENLDERYFYDPYAINDNQ